MPTRPLHLASLTGLRFFAAIHVLLYHAFPHRAWPGEPVAIRNIIDSGFVGVSLFFVLSGFILAYNYLHLADPRPVEPRDFWWARVARIYPVYLFSLLVALPLFVPWVVDKLSNEGLAGLAKVVITAGTNILLVQSWVPLTVAQWNSPAWSLACEAFFYLVFPVLGVWFVRMPRARLLPVAAAVWVVTMGGLWAYIAANPETAPLSARESSLFSLGIVKYNPLMRLPEFIVGIAAGVHFLHRQRDPAWEPGGGTALAVGGAMVSLLLMARSSDLPYPLLHDGLLVPSFAAMIYGLALGGGPLDWFLSRPLLILLGEASYSIYLFHTIVKSYLLPSNGGGPLGAMPAGLGFAVYALLTIVWSIAMLKLIETPARKALRRWGESRFSARTRLGRA